MKWKAAVGLFLVIASIVCMLLWENSWRDELTLVEVLVPSRDIEKGEIISPEDLTVLKINPQSRIDESLILNNSQSIIGKSAAISLKTKQQLVQSYFVLPSDIIPEDFRHFVIPLGWIYSMSHFVEPGMRVSIFTMPELNYLGTYFLADSGEYGIEIYSSLEDYYAVYESVQLGFSVLIKEE